MEKVRVKVGTPYIRRLLLSERIPLVDSLSRAKISKYDAGYYSRVVTVIGRVKTMQRSLVRDINFRVA